MRFDTIKGVRKGVISLGIRDHIEKNKDDKEFTTRENEMRLERLGFSEEKYFNNR